MLLAVPPTSPYESVQDLIEAARKAPGKLNLGAINPGSTQNLSAHLFQQVSGAQFTIVTYRTTPDLVTALLRGDVDLGFDYFAGFGTTIAPDKLHIIATSGEERDPLLKDVPTAKESGLPDYVVTSWNGIAALGGHSRRSRQLTQFWDQESCRGAGCSGEGAPARARNAREHAPRNARPDGRGYSQVARRHREGGNSQTISSSARPRDQVGARRNYNSGNHRSRKWLKSRA